MKVICLGISFLQLISTKHFIVKTGNGIWSDKLTKEQKEVEQLKEGEQDYGPNGKSCHTQTTIYMQFGLI